MLDSPVLALRCVTPAQVFIMDKRRAEEFGTKEPLNRIKRDLLLEVQNLQPADRVVLIGCTNDPQSCTKKNGEALLAAFDKHFYIPLPDYATRQARSRCAARYAFPGMTVTYSACRCSATVRLRNEAAPMLRCAERQAWRHCQNPWWAGAPWAMRSAESCVVMRRCCGRHRWRDAPVNWTTNSIYHRFAYCQRATLQQQSTR